jgi:hypothetical protein
MLCPPGIAATSQGCLWPSGTVATFSARRRKWRIAVPVGSPGASGSRPAPQPSTGRGAASYGFGWYGFGAASHVVIAETDTPPPGVQQVNESDFESMSGEAPTAPPVTPTTVGPPPPPQPIMTAPSPPARVDVGPTSRPTLPEQASERAQEAITEAPRSSGPPGALGPPGLLRLPAQARAGQVMLPEQAATLIASRCVARFNKTRKVFSIFCPVGSAAAIAATEAVPAGFGIYSDDFRCLYGDCGGFGQDASDTPPPGTVKVGETGVLPSGVSEIDKPFFKKPLFWIAAIGGVAVVGGGSYWLIRRRRKPA